MLYALRPSSISRESYLRSEFRQARQISRNNNQELVFITQCKHGIAILLNPPPCTLHKVIRWIVDTRLVSEIEGQPLKVYEVPTFTNSTNDSSRTRPFIFAIRLWLSANFSLRPKPDRLASAYTRQVWRYVERNSCSNSFYFRSDESLLWMVHYLLEGLFSAGT